MRRHLAALFACSLVAGCGGGGGTTGSIGGGSPPSPATSLSLRFFGTGAGDIDRVKISLLDTSGVSRPVNIGATDFTIEFWIKGDPTVNPTTPCTAGPIGNGTWVNGAVVVDRDVAGDGDFGKYGVALFNGQVAFGVSRSSGGQTLCGTQSVLDNTWHHVALTRQAIGGAMKIFVDGALDNALTDPAASGDVSYNPAHLNPDPNDAFLVLGAEKYDVAPGHAFNGFLDELRLSTRLRYLATFPPPATEFIADTDTAALYHFDEASGTTIVDSSNNGASPGALLPAASGAASNRSTDTPF
jgi:hypothetical protein